jgi:hypothetical protein
VRRYLPAVLNHVRFEASPAGKPVVQAYDWLRDNSHGTKPAKNPPQEVITNAWQRYVFRKDSTVDIHAYTFCMLDQLVTALHRRDVFTKPSWRYADPRANLLGESEWEAMRPVVCRTLGLSAQPQPVLDALRAELDRTYREVAQRLPNNPDVRFEKINGKEELIPTKEHRPAFAGKECNCLLSSHFKDQPSIDRSTLSEIASASASERGFSIQGSLLFTIA